MKVTVVVTDEPSVREGLSSGPGFSALIEDDVTVLFDTGPDPRLLTSNLEILGYSPDDVDVVVISHNHWDHTGGLDAVIGESAKVVTPERLGVPNELIREEWLGIGDVVLTDVLVGPPRERAVYVNGMLVTGCAHPGVDRFAEWCAKRGLKVEAVMGGFHMIGFPEAKVRSVAVRLKELGVKIAGPCHCSGEVAKRVFAEYFEIFDVGPGTVVKLG